MPDQMFAIGLDLGAPAESSALAVVEAVQPLGPYPSVSSPPEPIVFHVRHLQRFPRGTEYTHMGKYVAERLLKPPLTLAQNHTYFVVDQTAVGDPVVQTIEAQAGKHAYRVVIEGKHVETCSDSLNHIPKLTLIGGLLVSLEGGHFKIASELGEAQNLIEELIQYRNRPTTAASLNGEPWREGDSDDLLFATAIACWKLRQPSFFEYHIL